MAEQEGARGRGRDDEIKIRRGRGERGREGGSEWERER